MIGEEDVTKKQRQSVLDVGQRNQLEALQAEVRRNNETLTTLRRENKELRVAMQQSLRGQNNVNIDDHYQKEEELLHNKMAVLKRSLNAVKGKNGELSKEIERTIEETQIVQLEGGGVLDEGSAVAQKIRALENRLDKCLIKHNEVSAIRRTYETLLERLQLEQSGFDTQLAATEKALLNTEKELADLTDVGQEAAKGRDLAKAQVGQLRARLVEERRTHRKDIEQRRAFVQDKRDTLERKHNSLLLKMAQQEERHARLLNGTNRDNSKKRNNRSGTSSVALRPEEVDRAHRQKEAYLKLRDATMAANVTAVVEKIVERKQSHKQLRHVSTTLEAEVKQQTEERVALQSCWEEVNHRAGGALVAHKVTRSARDKYIRATVNGAGEDSQDADSAAVDPALAADYRLLGDRKRESRLILEEFEGHLQQRNNELEESEKKQEALTQLLLDVEVGVQHLAEKLSVQHGQSGLALTGSASAGAPEKASAYQAEKDVLAIATANTTNMDTLRSCNAKLQLMLEELALEEVDRAAIAMVQAKVLIPETNIRLPALAAAAAAAASSQQPHDRADGDDGNGEGDIMGARFSKFGATPAIIDDFPDNEIHDRQELKMMALATVEREEKKARKQMMRRKEETV